MSEHGEVVRSEAADEATERSLMAKAIWGGLAGGIGPDRAATATTRSPAGPADRSGAVRSRGCVQDERPCLPPGVYAARRAGFPRVTARRAGLSIEGMFKDLQPYLLALGVLVLLSLLALWAAGPTETVLSTVSGGV
jgi:hypothetical protein